MAYTKDGIMAQVYVAFGQGTGPVRVSQDTCTALFNRYYGRIDDDVLAHWGNYAVQALERVRALGRLMATNAAAAGKTSIDGADLQVSADKVAVESATALCGGPPDDGG
jgi:hypothetical protein